MVTHSRMAAVIEQARLTYSNRDALGNEEDLHDGILKRSRRER
jgi:hypothetical protein